MKILGAEKKETIVTLELTETELNTLVAGLGKCTNEQLEAYASYNNLKVLEDDESTDLYANLSKLAKNIKNNENIEKK